MKFPFRIKIEKNTDPAPQWVYEFGLRKVTDTAKIKGLNDEYNKEIVHYKAGKIIKIYPNSEEVIEILREQGIPVIDEIESEEGFEFEDGISFGTIFRPVEL